MTNDSEDIAKFITESKKWQDQILNKVNEHVTEKIEKAEKKIHFSRRESSPEFRKEEVAAMIKEAMEGPYDPNDPKPQGEKAPEHEGHHDADEEDNADEGEELNGE